MTEAIIRPLRQRLALAGWALWCLFFLAPSLFFLASSPLHLLFGNGGQATEALALAAVFAMFGAFFGALLCIIQFVIVGYPSPLRLLRRP